MSLLEYLQNVSNYSPSATEEHLYLPFTWTEGYDNSWQFLVVQWTFFLNIIQVNKRLWKILLPGCDLRWQWHLQFSVKLSIILQVLKGAWGWTPFKLVWSQSERFFFSYFNSCLFLMSFIFNLASGSALVWDWSWIVLFTSHWLWCGEQIVPGLPKEFKEGSGHGNGVKSCGKPYKCFSLKFCYYTDKVAWPFHFLFLHTSPWWLLPAFPPYPDPTYHTRQRLRCCAHTGSVELSTAQHGSSNPDGHNDAKILNPSL